MYRPEGNSHRWDLLRQCQAGLHQREMEPRWQPEAMKWRPLAARCRLSTGPLETFDATSLWRFASLAWCGSKLWKRSTEGHPKESDESGYDLCSEQTLLHSGKAAPERRGSGFRSGWTVPERKKRTGFDDPGSGASDASGSRFREHLDRRNQLTEGLGFAPPHSHASNAGRPAPM